MHFVVGGGDARAGHDHKSSPAEVVAAWALRCGVRFGVLSYFATWVTALPLPWARAVSCQRLLHLLHVAGTGKSENSEETKMVSAWRIPCSKAFSSDCMRCSLSALRQESTLPKAKTKQRYPQEPANVEETAKQILYAKVDAELDRCVTEALTVTISDGDVWPALQMGAIAPQDHGLDQE